MSGLIAAYSTQGLPDWPLADLFELVRRFGYAGAEIALTPEHIRRAGEAEFWRGVRRAAEAAGIQITALHLGNPKLYDDPSEPRWLHDDPARRARHGELLRAEMRVAEALGCPRVMTASGAAPGNGNEREHWERLLGGLGEAARELPPGVRLLVEHEPEHFINTTARILELHERSGGVVFSCVDVGHLEVSGEPIRASMERVGSIMMNVHLEDIRGRLHKHLLPGDGEIDFREVAAAIKAMGYAGPLTADLYPFAEAPVRALARGAELIASLMPAG